MSYTIFYARTSTDAQTIEHQADQARAAGYTIDEVITDEGVSGLINFSERPGGWRLLDKVRRGDRVLIRWFDRLGRNYDDVTKTVKTLLESGVNLQTVVGNFRFSATANPVERAIQDTCIAFMAASAQAEIEAKRIAQQAGIERAREKHPEKYAGRQPSFTREQFTAVLELAANKKPISQIASEVGISRQTVYRIIQEPENQRSALSRWGL